MRNLIFSVFLMLASRAFLRRDRRRGLPRPVPEDAATRCIRHRIVSGKHSLDAVLVEPASNTAEAAVLICHGIGETVEHWRAAQQLLAERGLASMVFNYSGYGRSTGWISPQQCERDTLAAFEFLSKLRPGAALSLLGYSLGSGVATAVVRQLAAKQLVLCAVFPSLRQAAQKGYGTSATVTRLLPAIWNTEDSVRSLALPILIVQGEQDRLFPPYMARQVAAACTGPCELIIAAGTTHNGPINTPQATYWSLVADHILRAE